jgi:four helix bundle protein
MLPGDGRYKNLEVWRLAHSFALEVYRTTKSFPKHEEFGLTAQIRRAVVSVPANIVEGYSRRGDKELARFIDIALGSLAEARYLLNFSHDLGYLSEGELSDIERQAGELGSKLWRFYERVRTNKPARKLERQDARG